MKRLIKVTDLDGNAVLLKIKSIKKVRCYSNFSVVVFKSENDYDLKIKETVEEILEMCNA